MNKQTTFFWGGRGTVSIPPIPTYLLSRKNIFSNIFYDNPNICLSIFIIKRSEIYLLYIFKKDIHSLPVKYDSSTQKQL